ncbi:RICIN domain-containing protein [Streptomyces sp. NPDC093252]|uniref:RICIN domain-containing protein n=1 Tax=Streptomyces sp. NPDC093252 TaxID=3154980 RepID=UPI003441BA4D
MARPEGTGDDGSTHPEGVYSGASDVRLTELLRGPTAVAYPALQELRARHRESVLGYARLCTTGDSAARQLAAQAFTLAARESARGSDPAAPWRHQLLLLAGRVARDWADGDRSAALDAGLLLVLNTGARDGPVPPLLAAYRTLPDRTRGLIWYGPVEGESPERTARLLGISRADVAYGTEPALTALGRALLRARLTASDDPDCQDFRRLIEESVRPDSPRHSPDLVAHMTHCPFCSGAYEELTALRDTPRTALAEGLLPWAGAAYAARPRGGEPGGAGAEEEEGRRRGWFFSSWSSWSSGSSELSRASGASGPLGSSGASGASGASRSSRSSGAFRSSRSSRSSRRVAGVSAGLVVGLIALLSMLSPDDPVPPAQAANPVTVAPPPPPPVTVTATTTITATAAESAASTPTPTPTLTSAPRRPSSSSSSSPSSSPSSTPVSPPGASYAQVVNEASGRCLEVRDGRFEKGVDVVTAPCSSAAVQRWRVDAGRGVVQSAADPEYCLDSRGEPGRGVGIWTCSSVAGSNGLNLRFTVDGSGLIRPAIAPDTAVTAEGGEGVVLRSVAGADGDAGQRWRAGRD